MSSTTTASLSRITSGMSDQCQPKDCVSEEAGVIDRDGEDEAGDSVQDQLGNILHVNLDGVNYFCTGLVPDMSKSLLSIRHLQLRDDDVLMVGFPKSGNHWIFEVICMLFRQTAEFDRHYFWERSIEFVSEDLAAIQSQLDKFESPRNLNTHVRPRHFPQQVLERKIKIVYLLRNPKDTVVSLYNMFSSFVQNTMRYDGSFNDFFDLYLRGLFFWGHWFDHVLSMEEFMKEHPDHPVFILPFERMREEPVKVIKELCAFLGRADDLAEKIARVTAFDKMKTVLEAGKMGHHTATFIQKGKPGILRKGKVGDWKNWLTVQQSEDVDKLFEEKMAGSKLAELVRQYTM